MVLFGKVLFFLIKQNNVTKIIKNSFGNFLVVLLVFRIVTGWIFSGWPQIWQKPSIPPEIQEARAETDTLWVNAFDATSDSWTDVGSSPYLSVQDQPTNYIYTISRNVNSGYYTFQTHAGSETINSVYLYIYAYGASSADFTSEINDTDTGLGPPTSWGWVSVDVSTILTTWNLINTATLLFDRPNTTNSAGVDAAYLYIDYTPVANQAPTWTVDAAENPDSTSASPTNVSSNVTFTATASDPENEQYY